MNTAKAFWALIFGTAISACSTVKTVSIAPDQLQAMLQDDFFPHPEQGFQMDPAPDFLRLPEQYRAELNLQVIPLKSEYERFRALRRWALRKFENFEFDTSETSSITQLTTNRKINCLSFSVLFVAAARYVDVPAEFQLVFAPPFWDRQNNSWINNQHINVTGMVESPAGVTEAEADYIALDSNSFTIVIREPADRFRYTVDVNPAVVSIRLRRQVVSDQQVLALYFSNKAIETLLKGDIGGAYQYGRAALMAHPETALAWNNLGVLYNRVGQPDMAIAAYQQAIELDNRLYSAKSNLARLYRDRGEETLATALEDDVRRFRNQNPYYHAALAENFLEEGDLESAKRHLEIAIERKYNEFYFYHLLAITNQQLGDSRAMMENLKLARRYAEGAERTRFSGKLQALERLQTSR